MITIKEITNQKLLKKFVRFPNVLYKDNPYFCPTLDMDEMENFNPNKNPAYEYCESRQFLAYDGTTIVGRIATIINHAFNKKAHVNQIRFTRYDTIDDIEVTKALMEQVKKVAVENNLDTIVGPLGFCDLDREGQLVEGFEEKNMFITIYNAPYYHEHLAQLGFVKDVDWVEYQLFPNEDTYQRMHRMSDIVQKRFGMKPLAFKHKRELKPIIPKVFELVNECYKHLYGVVEITERQIKHYTSQFLMLINLDFLICVEDANHKMIGFGLLVPSLFDACRKNNGRLFPFGWIPLLKAIHAPKVLDLYLIAIHPDYQGTGANAIIISEACKQITKHQIKVCETGPELENNLKVQSQWVDFNSRQHRRRRCYKKVL